MARSKTKRKPRKSRQSAKSVAPEKRGPTKQRVISLAVVAGLVVAAGWWWANSQRLESGFLDHVRMGDGALERVVHHADHGTSGHLTPGEHVNYGTDTPTSGRHDATPVSPGVYDTAQSPAMLVHSLEHGMVVIYYDRPPADAMATLEDWSALYGGPFSGLVVTRRPGLGEKVILTAWKKSLTLESFDADAAAAFIDAYRGRGPEHPVR